MIITVIYLIKLLSFIDYNMKIYVVGSTKNKFLPLDNIREKYLVDIKHEGDNIDFLNPWYCELTALYYMWKHVDDDIVGLEHYRRYFWDNNKIISEEKILSELKDYDIICASLATPIKLYDEVNILSRGYINQFLKLIEKTDNNFYNYLIQKLQLKRFYACNCFIGYKPVINEWCNYLFNILVEFEKKYPLASSSPRREGYFAEYLMGAWFEFNNFKIKHINMVNFNKNLTKIERKAII